TPHWATGRLSRADPASLAPPQTRSRRRCGRLVFPGQALERSLEPLHLCGGLVALAESVHERVEARVVGHRPPPVCRRPKSKSERDLYGGRRAGVQGLARPYLRPTQALPFRPA